jgi:hypothetical protein
MVRTASLDPIVFIIRMGESHELGKPYDTSATVIKQLDGSAEIAGLNGKFTIADFRELKRLFRAQGISLIRWKRIVNGEIKLTEYKVPNE